MTTTIDLPQDEGPLRHLTLEDRRAIAEGRVEGVLRRLRRNRRIMTWYSAGGGLLLVSIGVWFLARGMGGTDALSDLLPWWFLGATHTLIGAGQWVQGVLYRRASARAMAWVEETGRRVTSEAGAS